MSADNRICILQIETGQWAVWRGSASCEYHEAPSWADLFNTEAEAHTHAHAEEERIGYVEHGVQIIDAEEQMNSLCWSIEDLGKRLSLLRRTGSQFAPTGEDGIA